MKSIIYKIAIVFALVIGLESAAKATITIYPYFSFMYKDPASGYTYTLYWQVENSDGVISPTGNPWNLGNSGIYPMGVSGTYNPGAGYQVTEPVNPPIPQNCYRIVVIVVRSDFAVRRGWSNWTTAAGLQNNSLSINVNSF